MLDSHKPLNITVGLDMVDKDLDSRMTEMETEFKNMSKQLDLIAADMKQVLLITNQVSVISERQSNHQSDLNRAFEEIRKLNTNHSDYDKQQDDRISKLEESFQITDKESQAWVNKIKGGWTVFMLLYVIIQGIMVYGAKLVIDDVRQQHDQLIILNSKVSK